MLRIDVTVMPALLLFEVHGPLAGPAIADAIRQHHRELVGRGCLWDLRQADFATLQREDFPKISDTAHDVTVERRSGKVAYVVADARSYVTMCQYMNHTVAVRVPMEYAVFQDMTEARNWLRQDATIAPR